jgi:hypothetical protein
MEELETLRSGFVAFLDGLWWGLRDSVGPLSMYEGYSQGFRQLGLEAADRIGGTGPEKAAIIAAQVLKAIGLEVEHNDKEIIVKSCPIWNRIVERGLEYSFHVEEICWKPLFEGIGEKTGAKPIMENSLRLTHVGKARIEYKRSKARAAKDKGSISTEEYEKQLKVLDQALAEIDNVGRYRFD